LRSSTSGAADATASKMLNELTEAGLRDEGLVQGRDYVFVTPMGQWRSGPAFPALGRRTREGHPSAIIDLHPF